MKKIELYNILKQQIDGLEVNIGNKRQYKIDCPYCHKPFFRASRTVHASFGVDFGFHCFVCGKSASLVEFAKDINILGVNQDDVVIEPIEIENIADFEEPSWFNDRYRLFQNYITHPQKYDLWYNYAFLEPAVVDKYNLGVGYLPFNNSLRLICPIWGENNDIVTFRGRRINENDEVKWMPAIGYPMRQVPLQFLSRAEKGQVIVLCENYVDAILVNENTEFVGIPTMSVSYWFSHWREQLLDKEPKLVFIAYDADLAGNGPVNETHLRDLIKDRIVAIRKYDKTYLKIIDIEYSMGYKVTYQYKEEKGQISIPEPAAYKVMRDLKRFGQKSVIAKWGEENANLDIGKLWEKFYIQKREIDAIYS